MGKVSGLINYGFQMLAFSLAFFYVVEYVFVNDYHDGLGMITLFIIILGIMIYFLIRGRTECKHHKICSEQCVKRMKSKTTDK